MPVFVPPPPQDPPRDLPTEPSHGGVRGHKPEARIAVMLWCIQMAMHAATVLWLFEGQRTRPVGGRTTGAVALTWLFGGGIPLVVLLATFFKHQTHARPVRTARPLAYALAGALASLVVTYLLLERSRPESTRTLMMLIATGMQPFVWAFVVPRIVQTRYLTKDSHPDTRQHPRALTFLAVGALYVAWVIAAGFVLAVLTHLLWSGSHGPSTNPVAVLLAIGAIHTVVQTKLAVHLLFSALRGLRGTLAAQAAAEALE